MPLCRLLQTTIFCIVLLPIVSLAQNKASYASLRAGDFYMYPKNTSSRMHIRREGDYQYQINADKKDSIVWKLKWLNDSTYTEKYISGGNSQSPADLAFLKGYTFVVQIIAVADNYYVFRMRAGMKYEPFQCDTTWFKEKQGVVNNEIYKRIFDVTEVPHLNFSDTSQYALLYIYRLSAFDSYSTYIDDILVATMIHKTGYLFKLVKERQYTITSILYKQQTEFPLDVKFGHIYYLKAGLYADNILKSYLKPRLELVDAATGEKEFAEVRTK